ncbi:ubiquinol-cytochrome-c reductase complex assembly factor 3 [Oncorhynchus nerka]|uniref:Ubiquinol-cytochrome-c reductase complex assembly factor 3 n=7 Tax=Salmoninae TaxID=504568 RepID=A0A060WE90_ONCMY|nr:UNQ655/PRO1286 [Salmo salar]XP_020321041.1 ubiquinol-cytochrome-c reductase complex assembly factor 3 [Oncorhynchus kisutch]XP_021446917.1 ubiquinol-cytochrome-c reductase complex assembly factor 3 [Oncorhynchus mykiss]XP_023842952.1 ubiquinol-cytochrome-c reductase complex assembly factor 3 [Salvelinus alpinus]XP_024253777.1 ubiquinol-cytochrome-c reductase complex assembly factor 3 [Oncorhynchus tshawytscha]XP_029476608.1 ubiquinol-cytochrome-c reductase complex assembly factor 3 [Oncorhy|eukprot:NP_001140085.1 UNQ655/PRO1286 [Salmo salar]
MSGLRTVLVSTGFVGVVGIGYGMWSVITPGEERKREMLKNLPEANPLRMEETRKRNALMMQVLKEAAETDDNIARGLGPMRSQK